MELVIVILLAVAIVLLVVLLLRKPPKQDLPAMYNALVGEMNRQQGALKNDMTAMVSALNQSNMKAMESLGKQLAGNQMQSSDQLLKQVEQMERASADRLEQMQRTNADRLDQMQTAMSDYLMKIQNGTALQLDNVVKQMGSLEKTQREQLDSIRLSMSDSMKTMREENSRKLDEIRGTVDEKLQSTLEKRITESFKTVNTQLEAVYKELGEMQTLASDVGGLKKVLSGVKTRGILGEYQAGAILAEILTAEQYGTNVETVPGSGKRVEFAVKLPGASGTVWLPIDSKFPGERYQHLLDAQESGDKVLVELAYKELESVLTAEAKDISEKYIHVPYTTAFAIMFLPFEGLYAEVVNRGLLELFQTKYHVNVAGPSTLAALLNSLQMGFRTLAIQKKSEEVWHTLADVKTEFEKFEGVMQKMQTHLNQTSNDLEALMGTRTRAIQRKLRDIELPGTAEPGQLGDSAE